MKYTRPPIQEAVIELRFAETVDLADIEKLKNTCFEHYPLPSQPNSSVSISFNENGVRIDQQASGYIMTGPNGDEKLTIGPSNFGISSIGSYAGWVNFVTRFNRDKVLWEKTCGRLTPTRLGIRFVNRIDVPASVDEEVNWDQYLKTRFHMPDIMKSKTTELQMRYVGGPLAIGQWQLTLSVTKVQPAILNHQSIILDIDIGSNLVTKNDEKLFKLLTEGQHLKNEFFEASITEQARELFRI